MKHPFIVIFLSLKFIKGQGKGIFTLDGGGVGQAKILHQPGTLCAQSKSQTLSL